MSKPLHELGLDSLTAVELVNLIEGEPGVHRLDTSGWRGW
jgi:acyl carrier protein